MATIIPFKKKVRKLLARGGLTAEIVDYTLVYGELLPEELVSQVTTLLAQGWQPWGPPIPFRSALIQAMVKHAE